MLNQLSQTYRRTAKCLRDEDEKPVVNGLAMTPAQMAQLTAAGHPVSVASANLAFDEGTEDPSYELPIDMQRGIDPADVWNAEQDVKKKAVSAYKEARKASQRREAVQKDLETMYQNLNGDGSK